MPCERARCAELSAARALSSPRVPTPHAARGPPPLQDCPLSSYLWPYRSRFMGPLRRLKVSGPARLASPPCHPPSASPRAA